jgi:glycosyltransferase involved in cell wall biosynthesis
LVPIASDNTAIPEFLDDACGFLAKEAQGMAQAMKALADDPALFSSKSKASSLRVRIQCDQEVILRQELALILEGLAQASS